MCHTLFCSPFMAELAGDVYSCCLHAFPPILPSTHPNGTALRRPSAQVIGDVQDAKLMVASLSCPYLTSQELS